MTILNKTDLFHSLFDAFGENTDSVYFVSGDNPYRFSFKGKLATIFVGNIHFASRTDPDEYRIRWKEPLAEGRLLILSFFADGIHRLTANLAVKRNAYIAVLADRILIAHAEKGGKTEALCKEALTQGKPVFAIDSPDNSHLGDLGVVSVRVDDLEPLVAHRDAIVKPS